MENPNDPIQLGSGQPQPQIPVPQQPVQPAPQQQPQYTSPQPQQQLPTQPVQQQQQYTPQQAQQPQPQPQQPQQQQYIPQQQGQPTHVGQPIRPTIGQPGQPGQPGRPLPRPLTGKPGGPNPRKFVLGCLGFVLFAIILFVIFVIAFVSQTSATGSNGLASALGVNPAEFTNTLILLTNLIFGVITIITFFIAVFGLFRAGMAPKTDRPTRSAGFKQAAIAGTVFLVMTMLWVFVYVYLNGKKINIPTSTAQTQGIVTEPLVTTQLTAPVDIKFDGTRIPYNPNILELTFYQWDFGDGSSSTAPTVTHTYTQVGQFNVQLTVTARNKNTNETPTQTFQKLVTISNVQVSADFTATPNIGPAPLKVTFDASNSSSPAGNIRSYEWDFKGNNTFQDDTGVTVENSFEKEGIYNVKLRVTDSAGQTNVVTNTVTVGGPDIPVAVIDIPTDDGKYYVGKQLVFLGEKSTSPNGQVTKYEWDFGDESPKANTRTANHTYQTAGLYEVILTVTDATGKTANSSQKITIVDEEQPPQPIITTTPLIDDKQKAVLGQAPLQVDFDASKSTDPNNNIVEFKWDFDGDGKVDGNGTTASYVYKTAGTYNATLTAVDAAGKQGSSIVVINVAAQGLTARLTADKLEGNAPLTVTFDASASSYPGGQIASFEWDFGDGSPKRIDASQVSYKYSAIGTFTAKVTAKASDGKTSSAQLDINIRPISLQACFTPSTEQGPAPLDIEFDPRCSQGAVAKYLWDFGDGQTSRTRKPTHTFDKPGSYQVTLEVTDNENVVNTYSKNILVTGEITQ